MRLAVAVVLGVLTGVSAGCGSSGTPTNSDSPSGSTGSPSRSASTQATITWAKQGEVLGLDPQVQSAQLSWDVLFRIYEPLVRIQDDGTIGPLLASSWKQLSPVEYVFQLRRAARFSNGRPMTSADVVTSFRRVLDPELGSYFLGRLNMIDSVRADGRHAVRFKLKEPSGTFLAGLASLGAAVLPGKELKDGSFDPEKELLGTGPYTVEEHRQEQTWTLVANRHYWQKGYPKVPKLEILIVNDATARLAALRSGRADVVTSDDPDIVKLLDGTPNVSVVSQSTSDFYVLHLNAIGASSKLKDERVRRAIALAIDRPEMVELALGGVGRPMASGTVEELPDACEPTTAGGADIDEAKALLSDAGAEGLEFAILVDSARPIFSRIGQAIHAQLERVGLKPKLDVVESGARSERVYVKGDFDANLAFHTAYVDNWFGLSNWSPSTVSFSKTFGIDDASFNRWLETTATLEDGPDRAEVFQRMCDLTARQANIVPLASKTLFVAYRTDRLEPVIQRFEPDSNTLKNLPAFVAD